jgi:hypothetical protein
LNDLRDCLRYGDIALPGEPPQLFEVKSYTLFRKTVPPYWFPLCLSVRDTDAWWSVATGEVSLLVLFDIHKGIDMFAAHLQRRSGCDLICPT